MIKHSIIFLFCLMTFIVDCKKNENPISTEKSLFHSTLPVSDTANYPILRNDLVDHEGNTYLSWSKIDNAVGYEIDRTEDTTFTNWRLVYFGNDDTYKVGPLPSITTFFRLRVVYSNVVSRWSNGVRYN